MQFRLGILKVNQTVRKLLRRRIVLVIQHQVKGRMRKKKRNKALNQMRLTKKKLKGNELKKKKLDDKN